MRVGLTYDLKTTPPPGADLPDDFQEEFDSPATVEAIATVLRGLGHEILPLGDGRELLRRLLDDPPDFVFNFAEGQGVGRSREARVPAVLEMLGIPYTGSDPLTLAATLDKDCAKRIVQSAGVPVPRWAVFHPDEDLHEVESRTHLPYTMIVKPAWEGSSKGIRGKCVVDTPEELLAALRTGFREQKQPILAEEYIAGEELTVGVIGHPLRVAGSLRVVPLKPTERFVYSLEVKRYWENRVRYEAPARLPPGRLRAVEEAALTACRALGCRDIARVDFRYRDGTAYFLEVNPLPGLSPETSDFMILARAAGWTYEGVVAGVLHAACARQRLPVPFPPLSGAPLGQTPP